MAYRERTSHGVDGIVGPAARGERAMRLVIDTDTASDDAVALMLASAADATIEAVTIVAGNVPVELGTRNALSALEFWGFDVPVYVGETRPLVRPLQTAQHVHGPDGMGDSQLPAPRGVPRDGDAVDVLVDIPTRDPGAVTLVTLGPFTNLAKALERDPASLRKYRAIYCMAGTLGRGNITQQAEYNLWCDPEAAALVLESGIPLTFIGCDAARDFTGLSSDRLDRWRALASPRADFAIAVTRGAVRWYSDRGLHGNADLPDPLAMAVALDPTMVTRSESVHASVALDDSLRGKLVIHEESSLARRSVTMVTAVDSGAFWSMVDSMVEGRDQPLTAGGATP
jgi:purine nucleosidase